MEFREFFVKGFIVTLMFCGDAKTMNLDTSRMRPTQPPLSYRVRLRELKELGGNPEILSRFIYGNYGPNEVQAALNRADAEIARLKKEAEIRQQQEEARARQEAEKRRMEEEARAKREAELLKQQEEERAKQAEEVQQRMRDLENLGGNPAILSEFASGTRSPEEIIRYRATLSRADAEIARLKREAELNAQYDGPSNEFERGIQAVRRGDCVIM